jgi:hypothetical protein
MRTDGRTKATRLTGVLQGFGRSQKAGIRIYKPVTEKKKKKNKKQRKRDVL